MIHASSPGVVLLSRMYHSNKSALDDLYITDQFRVQNIITHDISGIAKYQEHVSSLIRTMLKLRSTGQGGPLTFIFLFDILNVPVDRHCMCKMGAVDAF